MQLLRRALRSEPAALDEAALEMATIESPGLDTARYRDMLDRIAARYRDMPARIAPRYRDMPARIALATPSVSAGEDGPTFVRSMNQYLFEELEFRGNDTDYYDPRNSCLDQVLDRRTGIPITLSVVYMEVARRLHRPVFGIGLPGHFVVEYNDGAYSTFIDPFHAGKLLTEDDCHQLARQITGVDTPAVSSTLAPVSTRYILVRMLNNLRSAYFRVKQYGKMAQVLDLLVEAFPSNAEYYKARGVARLHLREYSAAKADLEMYLKWEPQAEDRGEITRQLEVIHRWLARLN